MKRVEKRNRPPLSCQPCRSRKLKCNRGSPCDTCIKRDKQSSCQYAENANRDKPKNTTGDRLQNLENAVLQFIQKEATQTQDQPSTYTPATSSNSGTLRLTGGQPQYVDSTHWLSILNDIKEVREQLSTQEENDTEPQPEVDLVFPTTSCSISEILLSLPPRPVCDGLVSQYFNAKFMMLPIIHPIQFQKEYEQFWQDPSKTPMLWLGLLFSILGLATTLRQLTGLPVHIPAETFRQRTMQCLVVGRYTTAKTYALEILGLHIQSSFIGQSDSNPNFWFLMGIVIRLAFQMGYHRDPSHHPSLTPFESEMRRRVWAVTFQLDALVSFQMALPSMIPSEFCDTSLPRNLTFNDFGPDTTVLPPSRPLSDRSSMVFTIIKSYVMTVFKKIVAHTQSLSPPPLEITVMLDMEIRETYNRLPTNYKMTSISKSFLDSPNIIMEKVCIELLYLKGIMVLHRRFLQPRGNDSGTREEGSINSSTNRFRDLCLEAAMQILARQVDLHAACLPGGQMYENQWMLSSLSTHDFLIAAMAVCLELSTISPHTAERGSYLDALRTSHTIWQTRQGLRDAKIAVQALGIMIRNIESRQDRMGNEGVVQSQLMEDPVTGVLEGSGDLDWALLDQYFQGLDGGIEQGEDPYLGLDWMV
ncbi:hypothetical protein P154DRAFT_479598 [Amniculicola lignicola CBS 123094]|uniref:Zn(2)-C6 fungal-type domain-containing protein n=1 Tax=Amniculicola lignicola CBS 123094 TaxID=1392246 RepID=A0A6A5X5K1_9PLEO|nr:hypothetical protein P154DRAFT_479598 [Amniculicola lignicola CBS 123094]